MNKGPFSTISLADVQGIRKSSSPAQAVFPDQRQGLSDFAFAAGGDAKTKYWSPEKPKTAPLAELSPNTREKRAAVYNDAVNAIAAQRTLTRMAPTQSKARNAGEQVVGFNVVEADAQEVDTSEKRKTVARNLFK